MPTSNQQPPKAASLRKVSGYQLGQRFGIREAIAEHYVAPDNSVEDQDRPRDWQPTGRFAKPSVVGMRTYLNLGKTPTQVAKKGAYEEPEQHDRDED